MLIVGLHHDISCIHLNVSGIISNVGIVLLLLLLLLLLLYSIQQIGTQTRVDS